MISIIELMEKKTPLIKNTDRKKGMTLVEVMAAMAILSILFVGISGLIINTVKIEDKSNTFLDNTVIIRSVFVAFNVNGDTNNTETYIDNTRFEKLNTLGNVNFDFNTIENLQKQLINEEEPSDGNNYTVKINITKEKNESNIYKINVTVINNLKNEDIVKELYLYRN